MKNKTIACMLFCIITLHITKAQERVKYSYDAGGNRISRTYLPMRIKKDTTTTPAVLDSLYLAATNNTINLPLLPTENMANDGSIELKNMYPNPTKAITVLQFTGMLVNANLTITDITGKIISIVNLSGIEFELDFSLFPSGEFILSIETKEGKRYMKKLVKI